ncbi:MAG TPA: UDP-3-O-(3-hydroxymyristoyl)glucosamine N-acyltransferase, partial [Methylophilaceae bacterium]|nr:UDP-3-O-(3-hydroxymyristoyl)glucosamine N-acyltransferase [Methylophilaceae bacterium]
MLTLAEIVNKLGGVASGDLNTPIYRVGSLAYALPGAISFFVDTKYTTTLNATQASAVILKPEHAHFTNLSKIVTENPYAYFAKVSGLLNPKSNVVQGVHPTASVGSGTQIASSVSIGANAVIGDHVLIGEHVSVGAGCVIEDHVSIGQHTVLEPNVTVKFGITIGDRCHLYAGCVIGNDGFGYAEESGQWVKIPQVGRVVIGNDV